VKRRPSTAFAASAASAAWLAAFAFAAAGGACGGRIDGSNSFGTSGTSGRPGATDAPGHHPPGTGKPGRPSAAPLSNAAVASDIAEDYCKTFSSCCVGDGQAPIDVARCRELTSAAVEKELDAAGTSESGVADVAVCVAAIHTRIAACGKEDIHWPGLDPAIFAPESIIAACSTLLPGVKPSPSEHCDASTPCAEPSTTCAIDVCTSAPSVGAACQDTCLDTATCNGGTCVAISTADVGAACKSDDDCRLGLVCASSACAPAREHPERSTARFSPYRIGADTCRAFTYL